MISSVAFENTVSILLWITLLRQGGYLAQSDRMSARILSSHHSAFQRHRVNDIILGARWLWPGAANLISPFIIFAVLMCDVAVI